MPTDAVAELRRRLDVAGVEDDLLSRALVHRSWSFEHGRVQTNERLEFLGDAVLSLAVAQRLFTQLPDVAEGRLAKVRAHVVSEPELAEVARDLGLGELVLLGRGEAASGGADKDSILSDCFEAVLGAVHVSAGWEAARRLVDRLVGPRLDAVLDDDLVLDHKTALQELLVASDRGQPRYGHSAEGPDHAQRFTVTVHDGSGAPLGTGAGTSKKRAEQAAARAAWRSLRGRATTAAD